MSEWRLGQLVIRDDGVGVPGEGEPSVVRDAAALFEHTRTDALGRYRPLTGAKTLRTGWIARVGEEMPADEAVETVYPLALVHRRQLAEGTLRVVALEDVLSRQSGRYEDSAGLSERGRRLAVRVLCGECVRKPLWDGAACGPDEIPCPEPCSVMVALCREAVLWQDERPAPAQPDEAVAWAAFDEPGNELRERYLREWSSNDE
jgi:hypothetical protein